MNEINKIGKSFFILIIMMLMIISCASKVDTSEETGIRKTQTVTWISTTDDIRESSNSTQTKIPTLTSTEEPVSNLTSTEYPSWVTEPDKDIYLVERYFPGSNNLLLVDPITGQIVDLEIDYKNAFGYFWFPDGMSVGILYTNPYKIVQYDLQKNNRNDYPISPKSLELLDLFIPYAYDLAYSPYVLTPLYSFYSPTNDLIIVRNDNNIETLRNFSSYISTDHRFYIYHIDYSTEGLNIFVYDFLTDNTLEFDWDEAPILWYQSVWSPTVSELVFIGNYLFDITKGKIQLKIENIGTGLIWADNEKLIYGNSSADIEGNSEIPSTLCYSTLTNNEEQCIKEIQEYFQHDPYDIENESLMTYSLSPNEEKLGFSYFGTTNDNSYIGGDYCLYDLSEKSINCITDKIIELTQLFGEQKVRETITQAQWSNSGNHLVMHSQIRLPRTDEFPPGQFLFYSLETDNYFFFESHTAFLGTWRPIEKD